MGKKLLIGVALVLGACGGDPPSCQDAITHFYGTGCTFIGTNGTATSQLDAMNACTGINADIPERCRPEFDDWKSCLFGVDNDNQCADCSGEQDALFACD